MAYKCECISKSVKKLKELMDGNKENIDRIRTYFSDIGCDLYKEGDLGVITVDKTKIIYQQNIDNITSPQVYCCKIDATYMWCGNHYLAFKAKAK